MTLHFESPRAAQALYGGDLGLLRHFEETLGVKVTAREAWLRIDGEPEAIDRARRALEQLDAARQQGIQIRKFEFNYALRSVSDPDGGARPLPTLKETRIQTSGKKPPVLAKTASQLAYVKAIEQHDVVFGIGPAGTGKTFIAVAMAVAALRREQVGRIILTRPAVEAGEALGFLPGDLQEKIFPYLRPLYDSLNRLIEPEEMQRYLDRKMIEVAPLAYMRGRTLDEAFIILDEAQNTTTEQMFMFLTRLGQGAKCVVTGDRTQIDLPPNRRSGLVEAIQALKDIPGIAFCGFDERDVVRHELVQTIIRAYRLHRYGEADAKGNPRGERGAF
ncbi:MAG: PhoH family protein [Verrucomicrobia bacterium]|nr:PhoH family protein [Verrucomicrobiota bacterium]